MTTGPRLTTSACMKDIEFVNFRGGIINQRSEAIFSASAVRITFREQKNKEKWDAVTQEAINDPLTNPVRIMAWTIRHLWSLPSIT